MGKPSASDPLGQRPDPTSVADMLDTLIDAKIEQRLTGLTNVQFSGVRDFELVQELIARGWCVFRPITMPKPA